jgi:hypothetical protein
MKLKDFLIERKSSISKRWFDKIIESYPSDSSDFLKNQKNRFANPVGYTISQGINGIIDELAEGLDPDKIFPFLDDIIRVKAVQEFSPSQAISFIFLLKKVIRDELGREIKKNQFSDELAVFEAKIDNMALISFDIYMKCRERIYEIKVDEVKRMTFRLIQRANLICEVQDPDPESDIVLTKNIKG